MPKVKDSGQGVIWNIAVHLGRTKTLGAESQSLGPRVLFEILLCTGAKNQSPKLERKNQKPQRNTQKAKTQTPNAKINYSTAIGPLNPSYENP